MQFRVAMFALALSATAAGAAPLVDGTAAQVKADFELICNAPARSGAAKIKDPSEKATKLASWLFDHIRTRQAMDVLQAMAGMAANEKAPALRKAARDAGYRGACPLADEK